MKIYLPLLTINLLMVENTFSHRGYIKFQLIVQLEKTSSILIKILHNYRGQLNFESKSQLISSNSQSIFNYVWQIYLLKIVKK